MIRFLFVILAVVAAVLAWLFRMPWLYIVAAVLLVVAGALLAAHIYQRHKRETRPYSEPKQVNLNDEVTEEDLRRAGILDVRVRRHGDDGDIGEAAARSILAVPAREEISHTPYMPPPPTAVEEGEAADDDRVEYESSDTRVVPVYRSPRSKTFGPNIEASLKPYLTSIQATIGAHTVCLFRIDETASRYRLVSIVSRDPLVVSERSFPFTDYFLSRVMPEPTLLDLPQEKLKATDLGYYREPPAIGQVAIIPVLDNDELRAFLVADVLAGQAHFSDQACELMAEAGRLLGHMLGVPPSADVPIPRQQGPRLRLVEVGRHSTHRRVISEEMQKAREENYPLALALVYLYADLEAWAAHEDRTVDEAEENVLETLRALTPGGRVERFGDMGFGVFHYGEVEEIAAWVQKTHATVNEAHAPQEGQISIGVAVLSDRRTNPDDLQIDAARALRSAFETGESTIVVG